MRIHERSCVPVGMLALVAFGAAHAETAYRASIEYDELGRVIRSLNAAGQVVERHAYDAVGSRTSTTDALGRTTTYAYDAHGRIVERVDPAGARTRFAYDAADRLTQVTDPRGLMTMYVYDGFGQLLREVSPDRGTIAFDYSDDGALQRKTFAGGQSLDHEYDALGRLIRQGNATESRSYRYDACANGKGRLCGAATAETAMDLGYTQQGQIEYKIESVAGQTHETLFAWDAMGRMVGLGYPSGLYIGYQYEDGALKGVHARIAGQTTPVATHIAHQPFGHAMTWWHGNGLMRTQHIDLDGRLMGIGVASGTATRQSLTYQRNVADEITKVTNGLNATLTQTFAYDTASRLVSADLSGQNVDFMYDTNGNRILHKANALSMQGVLEPNTNRLTNVAGDKTSYLNYDANGNRTHVHHVWDHIADYSYDSFQRLSAAYYRDGTGSSTTYFTTNALDQRVGKAGSSGTTRFTYLGQNQLLGEVGANGWKDYIWMGDTLIGMVGTDRMLRHVHTDHVGRPEAVTDAAGQAVWRANNYAFERTVSLDQIGGLNIGFPGQYWDAEFKLWFNGYRYYDSHAQSGGRYTQPDPIGLLAGTNLYGYVRGNPVSLVDPLGLADMILLAPGAPGYAGAQALNPVGVYSVIGHGNPHSVNDGYGKSLSPAALADRIRADPKYKLGTPVELYACRTGQQGYGSQLAAALGAPVSAPNNFVFLYSNGSVVIAGKTTPSNGYPNMSDTGHMVTFPGGL